MALDVEMNHTEATGARERIVAFLAPRLAKAGTATIDDDTPLLAGGTLDSLGILELVTFLTDELGIEIEDEDFVEENFGSIGRLAAFVADRSATR
jgi:acyl carrier protein